MATWETRSSSPARSSATAARGCARSSGASEPSVGAWLDPALAGLHGELGGAITAELVSKLPGDVGGLPVRRADGSLALAEASACPRASRTSSSRSSTRTRSGSTSRPSRRPRDSPGASRARAWTTAGRSSSNGWSASSRWWHPSRYVHVSRAGAGSRFVPVKDEDDLAAAQDQIAAIVRERLDLDI